MPATTHKPGLGQTRLLLSVALVAIPLAVYWPVAGFAFITCDDTDYVTDNPVVPRGLTWDGLLWAFRTFYAANWHPMTWLSHMLDVQFFGLHAGSHHLVNLLFHTANTLLLFLLFQKMTGALWRSAFVAALFSLHPLHIESVAWISERKDVLSTFFGLLSLWAYTCYVARLGEQSPPPQAGVPAATQHTTRIAPNALHFTFRIQGSYLLSLLLFALSLMSKPMLVTLPCLMLLLDCWPLRRLQPATRESPGSPLFVLIREKLPFFVLSAGSSVVTILAQRWGGAMTSLDMLPLKTRIANAVMAYALYLAKTVWPNSLSLFYPQQDAWSAGLLLFATLCFLTVSAAALLNVRRRPWLTVGWFWFLGTLVPVIGLVQVGAQAMADRYTYVPLIGIFVLAAWGVPELLNPQPSRLWLLRVFSATAILACAAATVMHLPRWQNTETLCQHALRVTPNNFLAHTALGAELANQGKLTQAKAEFASALKINPDYFSALSGMGKLLFESGNETEAAFLFKRVLELQSWNSEAHYMLGGILARQGSLEEAARHFDQAILLDPLNPRPHEEMAALLMARGDTHGALNQGLTALRLAPDSPSAHFAVATALFHHSKFQEAVAHYQITLRHDPKSFEAWMGCGVALQRLGKLEEAGAHLREAARLRPDDTEAHRLLTAVYSAQNRPRDQAREYSEMLRLRPDWPEVLNNLAWLLATHADSQVRDGTQAVPLAQRACQLTESTNLPLLSTLAAAYAEAGKYDKAMATQQKVCDLAIAQQQTNMADRLQRRLELYRSNRPYHEPASGVKQ